MMFTADTVGMSVEDRPIVEFAAPGVTSPTVLILGGVHGDEPKSVFLARQLLNLLRDQPPGDMNSGWVIVPLVNPDGYERRKRRNANGVDINRNFPTRTWSRGKRRSRMFGGEAPASEPETRAVMALVERYRPDAIVTIHSIGGNRHCNNFDGPAEALAKAMSLHNRYPVKAAIGYPTPGSFGTWAGVERGIPMVTLELPSHHSAKRCWESNRAALLCAASASITNATSPAAARRGVRRASLWDESFEV